MSIWRFGSFYVFLGLATAAACSTATVIQPASDMRADDAGVIADGGDGATCVADLSSDSINCGACGHSCLGGACSNGACQPRQVADVGDAGFEDVALTVDETAIYWVIARKVWSAPKTKAGRGQPLFDAYYDFTPSHALRSSDTLLYLYTGDCCQIPNVFIFDKRSKQMTSAGDTGGYDTFTDVLLDGPVLVGHSDDDVTPWMAVSTADNDRTRRDIYVGAAFVSALASNESTLFFGMRNAAASTRSIGKLEKSAVKLGNGDQMFTPTDLTTGPWKQDPSDDFGVLAANARTLYAFAANGTIYDLTLPSGKLTKVVDDPAGVAIDAAADDATVCWASASQSGGAIECLATAPGSSVVTIAKLSEPPRAFVMDSAGFYWSTGSGVWALAR